MLKCIIVLSLFRPTDEKRTYTYRMRLPISHRFFARTVLVTEGRVDEAYSALERALRFSTIHTQHFDHCVQYTQPSHKRRHVNHERCRRIYDLEMQARIDLLSRTLRDSPWLR